MVVPYVKSIENSDESMVNDLGKNMSDIINDHHLSDENKMKLYHQNLNKLLIKYDPETYGVTPTIAKLAKLVLDFINRENDNNNDIEKSFFEGEEKSQRNDLSQNENTLFLDKNAYDTPKYKNKSENILNPDTPKRKVIFKANTFLKSPDDIEQYYSPNTELILQNYEKNTKPYNNLRSVTQATNDATLENKKSNINTTTKPEKKFKKQKLNLDTLQIPIFKEKIKENTRKASANLSNNLKTGGSLNKFNGEYTWLTKKFF